MKLGRASQNLSSTFCRLGFYVCKLELVVLHEMVQRMKHDVEYKAWGQPGAVFYPTAF